MTAGCPPHVSYPDSRAGDILDAGLDLASVALDVLAYSESSRYALDSRVAMSRLRRLRGWSRRPENALVDRGFWRLDGTDVVLCDYLRCNRTRSEIDDMRSKRVHAGQEGGEANAARARRGPGGKFEQKPDRKPDRKRDPFEPVAVARVIDEPRNHEQAKQDPKHLLGPSTSTSTSTSSSAPSPSEGEGAADGMIEPFVSPVHEPTEEVRARGQLMAKVGWPGYDPSEVRHPADGLAASLKRVGHAD